MSTTKSASPRKTAKIFFFTGIGLLFLSDLLGNTASINSPRVVSLIIVVSYAMGMGLLFVSIIAWLRGLKDKDSSTKQVALQPIERDLKRLNDMLASGGINDEEYNQLREKILSGS